MTEDAGGFLSIGVEDLDVGSYSAERGQSTAAAQPLQPIDQLDPDDDEPHACRAGQNFRLAKATHRSAQANAATDQADDAQLKCGATSPNPAPKRAWRPTAPKVRAIAVDPQTSVATRSADWTGQNPTTTWSTEDPGPTTAAGSSATTTTHALKSHLAAVAERGEPQQW